MRFASLGSGSRGNATLVQHGSTHVLVDCGFSTVEVERRMQRLGTTPEALQAILVTHEHADHIQGVARLARKYSLDVWMTHGTYSRFAISEPDLPVSIFSAHDVFAIRDLEVHPYPVPHDAREPAQFVFTEGARKFGLLTDAGSITPHIIEMLDGLDGLVLESNHDLDMLWAGSYPASLKERVAGRFGHLNNQQAAELLSSIDLSSLQHLVAAHISEKNNHPDKVVDSWATAIDVSLDWVCIADQETGLDWREIV